MMRRNPTNFEFRITKNRKNSARMNDYTRKIFDGKTSMEKLVECFTGILADPKAILTAMMAV